MLHRINLPDCRAHLDWIVQFQCNLLHALCDPTVVPVLVDIDWVKSIRADVDDDWMTRFCGWKKEQKSILQRMQAIAGLTAAEKQIVIDHYEANLQYPDAFDDDKADPPPTIPLPNGLTESAAKAYRGFFEMFYAPIFYKASNHQGYPVEGGELAKRFWKAVYLQGYHEANPKMAVCPLCDGSMDGAELDHWLPKEQLPELNCHPLNLVEICGTCNSVINKGKKPTFDESRPQPFANWFHPYLRQAEGCYSIDVENGRPTFLGNDENSQQRIENLDRLINLSTRWSQKFDNLITRIEERIRHHRRRGRSFDKDSLIRKIQDWLIDARSEIGLGEYKLLESVLLDAASNDDSDLFTEFWEYACEAAQGCL